MRRSLFFLFFGIALCFCAMTSAAQAQATRTWISGTGDDANPCSRTAPCKTWAGAISKTQAGGEIDVLDPGGFGALTITKALTLDGGGGQVASTLVGGTPGFVVNAGTADKVSIRNVRIQGVNGSGTTGINFIAGLSLTVKRCTINGFGTNGIDFEPVVRAYLYVEDTIIDGTGQIGLIASTTANGGGLNRVELKNTTIINSGQYGLEIGQNTKAAAWESVFSRNGTTGTNADGVLVTGATSELSLDMDLIMNNGGAGIHTSNTGTARVNNSTINNNSGAGVLADGGTSLTTYQNNRLDGNGAGGGFTGNATPH